MQVVTEAQPFPAHLPVKRVSVNSFGYGGTNGHILIEGVDSFLPNYKHGSQAKSKPRAFHDLRRPFLLAFSAHDKPTLKRNLVAYRKVAGNYNLLDLSYTLANRRSRHQSRGFVVTSHASLDAAFANDAAAFSFAEKKKRPEIGFAFTGQGAQWAKMGYQLMVYYPSFLKTIRVLDHALGILPDAPEWTIEDALLEEAQTSRVNQAEFSQPLCTAIQIAVVELLSSWNIRPKVTVGHSSGEIAAAFAAGLISATEAIIVAYYRGQAVKQVNTNGAMMAVGLSSDAVAPYIANYEGQVVIACHNSPSSVTLSGDAKALDSVKTALDAESIFARIVKTNGKAYHSHHMNPSAVTYENLIQQAKAVIPFDGPVPTGAVMVSSVTNAPIAPGQAVDEKYWSKNLISPVQFNQAVQNIATTCEMSVDMLIEIGPHSALSGPIKQISKEYGFENLGYIPTLVRNEDSAAQMLKVAGDLFLRDYPVDMERVTAIEEISAAGKLNLIKGSTLVDLPTYQWNYSKKLWAEPRASAEHRAIKHMRHDVLGTRMPGCSAVEPVWRNVLRIRDLPWLRDHTLGGEAIFPAAGYFSMAIEAVTQVNELSSNPVSIDGYVLRDISIKTAMVTPDDDNGVEVMFSLRPSVFSGAEQGNWYDFSVCSVSEAGHWSDHMTGTIGINCRSRGQTPKQLPNLPQRATGKAWNEGLRGVGFDYGPTFQDMTDIRSNGKNYVAASNMIIKQECGIVEGESRYALHPGTVDACLQLIIVSIYAGQLNDMTCGAVPIEVDEVAIWPPTADQLKDSSAHAYSWTDQRGIRSFDNGSQLVASNGEMLMDITNMRCVAYEAAVPRRAEEAIESQPYQETIWKYDIDSLTSAEKLQGLNVSDFVQLVAHKTPGAKVLEIGCENASSILAASPQIRYAIAEPSDEALESAKSEFEGPKNVTFEKLDVSVPHNEEVKTSAWDLIIATGQTASNVEALEGIRCLLAANGRVILRESISESLASSGLHDFDIFLQNEETKSLSFSRPVAVLTNGQQVDGSSKEITLIYREKPAAVVAEIENALAKLGFSATMSRLDTCDIKDGENAVVVGDLEGLPVLATLTEQELAGIKHLTSKASSILWVTGGGLLTGKKPEYGMTNGLARSITSEQASLDFTTLDFDLETTSNTQIAEIVTATAKNQINKAESRETEYYVSKGSVYISRVVANQALSYASKQNVPQAAPLEVDQHLMAEAQSGKIIFHVDTRQEESLGARNVEVKLVYSGVNKEDVLVITGHDYPTTFSHEICGIVSQVGSEVSEFTEGDMVVGFSFDKFATFQSTSADLLQKVEKTDALEQLAASPWTLSTALYGLREAARVQPGEKVLILSGTGTTGAAAIRMAQILNATPFVVAESETQAQALAVGFGLSQEQILIAPDMSLTSSMKALTDAHEFDVIFGSGYTDPILSRECWRNIAPLGRYVDFGRKNVLKRSFLDTIPLHRGASYLSFDMLELFAYKPQILSSLLQSTVALFRQEPTLAAGPFKVFDLAELDFAVSVHSDSITASKSLISYKPSEKSLSVLPAQPTLRFRADATYLLVGCLGGLGRSLTSWMTDNGARRFAFLSRSGTDQEQASILVNDLEASGIACQVIRGDAAMKSDVERAVQSIPAEFPIRGVVQAAMVLRVCIHILIGLRQVC